MCGITGTVCHRSSKNELTLQLALSVASLQHRGPNHQSTFEQPPVFLGHTRLSILDPLDRSHQPFKSACGRYVLVFNGEIYNYKSLRDRLQNAGGTFSSEGDTEVLLQWLIAKGADGIAELSGCFAFALWDIEEESLLLARDRIGIKPLLYCQKNGRLSFASETRALLPYLEEKSVDHYSLRMYLHLGFVPSPNSMLEGVRKLQPGKYLIWKKGKLKQEKYSPSPQKNIEQDLGDVLRSSVQDRLQSDKPLGVWLSGGVDSSILAALAHEAKPSLPLFAMSFPDHPHKNEFGHAQAMAKHLKADLHEIPVTTDQLNGHLDAFLEFQDEPFADSTAMLTYILAKETAKQVTVVLSGDGADELFAGYKRHRALWLSLQGGWKNRLGQWSAPILKAKAKHAEESSRWRSYGKYASGLNNSVHERYWQWSGLNQMALSNCLIQKADTMYLEKKKNQLPVGDQFLDFLHNDLRLLLPDQMLQKSDKYGLANALEVRVPFLDDRVVQFAQRQKEAQLIDSGDQKIVLKSTFRHLVPKGHFERPKQGFEMPLKEWFEGGLKEKLTFFLSAHWLKAQGLFDPPRTIVYFNSKQATSRERWTFLMFQLWWQRYFC